MTRYVEIPDEGGDGFVLLAFAFPLMALPYFWIQLLVKAVTGSTPGVLVTLVLSAVAAFVGYVAAMVLAARLSSLIFRVATTLYFSGAYTYFVYKAFTHDPTWLWPTAGAAAIAGCIAGGRFHEHLSETALAARRERDHAEALSRPRKG